MRLFEMHGTMPRKATRALFAPFDAYCAANLELTPPAAARARVDVVWGLWTALSNPEAGVAQLVGYYIDTHVPLILASPAPISIQLVYKAGLNPEQQGMFPCTLDMMLEAVTPLETSLHALVRAACSTPGASPPSAPNAPIFKLIRKGFPNQSSVRYIRPQFQRCNTTTASRALAVYLFRLTKLGGYRHTVTVAGVDARLRVYDLPDACVFESVAKITSRALYTMVAEAIAAIFKTDVALAVRAGGVLGGVQLYIAALTATPQLFPAIADAPTAASPNKKNGTTRFVVTQVPLTTGVATIQETASMAATGLRDVATFCCRMCGIVHVRTDAPVPRTTKKQIGVALDLTTQTLTPRCNNCNLSVFVERLTLTGFLTTGCVSNTRRTLVTIVVCGKCAVVTTTARFHGLTPLCLACFQTTMRDQLAAIVCVCGKDSAGGSAFTVRGGKMHAACAVHKFTLPATTTCPLTPVATYIQIMEDTKRRRVY